MATNVLTKFSFISKANIVPSSAAGLDPSQPLTIDTSVTGDDRDDGYESPDVVNSDVSSSQSTNSTSSGSGDNGDTVGGERGDISADVSQNINPENTETSLRLEDRPRILLDSLDFHNSRIHSPPLARRDHVTAADDADSSDVLATTAKSSSGRQPRFVSLTDVDDEDTKLSDELATVVNLDAVTLDALLTRDSYNSSTVTPTHRPRKETSLDDLIPLESSSDLVGFGALGGVTGRAIGQPDVTDSTDYPPPIVISSDPPANLRPALKSRDGSKPINGKKTGLSFDQRVQVVYRDVLDEHIRQKYAGNTDSQQEGQGRELSDNAPAEPSIDVTGQNDDVIRPVIDNNTEPAVNQPSIINASALSQQSFSIPRVSSLGKVGDSSTPVDASLSTPSPRSNNERSMTAADGATPSDSDRLQQVDNNRSQVKRSSHKLQRTTADRNDARGDVSITAAGGAGTVSSRDNQQTKSSIAGHLRDRNIQQHENSLVLSSSADKPELNNTNSGFYQISPFNGSNSFRQRPTNTSAKPTISNDDSELIGRPSPSVTSSHAKSTSLPSNLTPSQMYDTSRSASLPPNTSLSNYNTDAVIPRQVISRPQPSVTADNFKQIRPGSSADELLSERGMPASLNRPSGQGQDDSNSRVPSRSSADGQSSLTLSQPITTVSQPLPTSTVQMRKRSSGVPVNNNNNNKPNDNRPSSVQNNYLPAYGVDNRAGSDEDDYIRSHQTTDVMARLGAIKRDDQRRASASTGSGSQRVQELRTPVKTVDRPSSFHTTLSLTDSQPTNQQRDSSDVSNIQHQRRGSDDVKRRPLSQQVDHPPPQMRTVNGVTAVPRPPRALSMSLSQPQQVRLSRMPEDILRGVAPYSVSTTYTPAFIPASSFPSPTKSNADTTAEMRIMTASATSLTLPAGGGGAIVRGQRSRESGKRASFASTADILKMMKMQRPDPTYRQNTPADSSPNSKQ